MYPNKRTYLPPRWSANLYTSPIADQAKKSGKKHCHYSLVCFIFNGRLWENSLITRVDSAWYVKYFKLETCSRINNALYLTFSGSLSGTRRIDSNNEGMR